MSSAAESEILPPPVLEQVSAGVHAYLQPDGSWGLNNVGVLVGRDRVYVVDTCFTERRTRALLAAVAELSDKPISTLLNTHHHGDHTYGNHLLGPGVTIVGHERTRAEVLASGLATTGVFPGVEWGDLEISPPFVTFTDELTIWFDDEPIVARHIGPAHTTNDVVYHLPERRLAFVGDLVFNGGTPFVLMGSVAGSLRAYEQLRDMDLDVVVPGHGPVCDASAFDEMAAYLRFVQDLAAEGHGAARSPLEVARAADLGRYAGWTDAERLVGNLHRAYSELRGEPEGARLDYSASFADMTAFNGGEPPRCLA